VPSASSEKVPRYYESLDFPALWQEYEPAPDYFSKTYLLSGDELRSLQETRFAAQMKRAWRIPFYQKHWRAGGMDEGDIRSLSDLEKIPPFSVYDLRDAITRAPPWGDLIALDPGSDQPMPLVLHTSGGTTGLPRPMIYAPRDREVMNIITGRRLYMQGVRAFDIVQVALSLGLANGGFMAREGIWKYTGAIPVMTGSGTHTPTRRQIEIMQAWKCNVLIGFPSYLRHMGLVMRDQLNLDPHSLKIKSLIVHLGVDDRASLEALWNAKVYDTYGTNECGSLAAECEHQTGMHIFEDAFVLEIMDLESGRKVPPGERGTIYQTTLFKHLAPLIRFNSNDVSSFATGGCPCGCSHRRLTRIYGRSDNMVKLRGTNIFPEAIGEVVSARQDSTGEYLCIVETAAGMDRMQVLVETVGAHVDPIAFVDELSGRLKEVLGVKVDVEAAQPGQLSERTGLNQTSKVRRLIDNRK
jgi:phenylacetate-CoA ligase